MLISKKRIGNELYLYIGDELIYKRWLDTGQSATFDVMPYDRGTYVSIRDEGTFTSSDWNHLHDCLFEALGMSLDRDLLYELFVEFPDEIKREAFEYGVDNPVWKKKVTTLLKES